MLFKSVALLSLALASSASPVPAPAAEPEPFFQHGAHHPAPGSTWTKLNQPASRGLTLKRSPEDTTTHPLIRQVQKINYAHKRHAKRLGAPPRNYKRALQIDPRSVEWVPVKRELAARSKNGRKRQDGGLLTDADVAAIIQAEEEAQQEAEAKNQSDESSNAQGSNQASSQQGTEVTQKFTAADKPDSGKSIALNEDGNDITYFSEILVGSNKKPFTVVMDTGSSDLWVPALGSTNTHSTLGPGDSQTLKVFNNKPFSITYGSGQVSGVLIADTVGLGGFNLNTTFGAATFVSQQFNSFIPDGILGLATTKASNEGVTVPVQQLADAGQIPAAQFGVHLQRASLDNDGAISFGTPDTKFIEGGDASKLTFADNISAQGLWEVAVQDIQVGGKSIGVSSSTSAIVDTGTTLALIPNQIALKIHQALSPQATTNNQGSFTLPCNTKTTLAMNIGGASFQISPKDYIGQPSQQGGNTCISNIIGQAISQNQNQMLLGDVFLKNVYTLFDLDHNRVGFAVDAVNNGQQ